jgi:REP element-mobilizing transposase RayT
MIRPNPDPKRASARILPGKARQVPVQLAMPEIMNAPVDKPRRGGKRAGAGRKRAPGVRPSVPHRPRAKHATAHPVHVTLRARAGLPSLRSQVVHEMFRKVLVRQRKRHYSRAFHVVEFSIQDNHVHLIVEATGAEDAHDNLRSGVSGLVISFAKRLNGILDRKGKVWGDRWHGRELGSPREVRNAIVYVFRNLAKHGTRMLGDGNVDPLSSAPRFQGWTRPLRWPFPQGPWPIAPPKTWLLGTGWRTRGGGPIDPREVRSGDI